MRRFAAALLLMNIGLAWAGDVPAVRKDIDAVLRAGKGLPEGRAAWERLSKAGPDSLLPILEAMQERDVPTQNWLRTAFDRIADRALEAGGKGIDADGLFRFTKDANKDGRAWRLALELVEKLRPGTSDAMYGGWTEDPEFRYEAVGARLLRLGTSIQKTKDETKSGARVFQAAFAAARDQQQAREAAAGPAKFGINVSVAEHLGFLTDWYLIGPFDGKGMKGFKLDYAPQRKIDLKEQLPGQNGLVRWKRYKVQQASNTSGARHQALVNLREKDALGDADDAVAFTGTEFTVEKAGTVEFRGAADDNFTVWVNGKKAFGYEEWRNGVRLDRHRFRVPLQAGKNTVLVKICQTPAPNPEPNWEFFLRVVDETGKGIAMKNALP